MRGNTERRGETLDLKPKVKRKEDVIVGKRTGVQEEGVRIVNVCQLRV